MGLYLSIVLLSLLIGFGGDGTRAEELQLLWGTSVGLLLAHLFALRLTLWRPARSRVSCSSGSSAAPPSRLSADPVALLAGRSPSP